MKDIDGESSVWRIYMSDAPSVRKNFVYSTIYQILLIIMPFITAPYLARVLGADNTGIQSYAESIQSYFLLISALGTPTYGAREIAQHRDDKYLRSKLFWEIELMTVFTSIVSLILWIFLIVLSSKYKIYYIAMIPYIFASMLDITWFFRGLEKFKLTVTRNIVFQIIGIILMFLFVKTKNDLCIYIIILSVTKLLSSASLWTYLGKYIVKIEFRKLSFKEHLRQTFFYFIPTIATSIYTVLDRTLIGLFTVDDTQNGYYLQAERVMSIAKSISYGSINSVVGVRIAYLFTDNKIDEIRQRISNSLNYILFMSIGCACGITAIAHNFVPLFFGNEFLSVECLLYILCPIIIIIGISNCLETHYYTPSGRRTQSTKFLIIGSIVNLLLNLILIPKFYAYGAAFSSIFAELVITVLYVSNSNGYITIKLLVKNGWKKFLSGICMVAIILPVGYELEDKNMLITVTVQVIIGAAIYVVGLIILKDKWVNGYIKEMVNKAKKIRRR